MEEWFYLLFSSPDFWTTLISALIGGLVAFGIAFLQVKKSEREMKQQRHDDNVRHAKEIEEAQKRVLLQINETKKHEREMVFVRTQLEECKNSIDFISKLPDAISDINLLTLEIIEILEREGDALSKMNQKSQLIIKTSFGISRLYQSAKICDLSDFEKGRINELKSVVYAVFEELKEDSILQKRKTGISFEEFKIHAKHAEDFTEKIDEVISDFGTRYEQLINKFK